MVLSFGVIKCTITDPQKPVAKLQTYAESYSVRVWAETLAYGVL